MVHCEHVDGHGGVPVSCMSVVALITSGSSCALKDFSQSGSRIGYPDVVRAGLKQDTTYTNPKSTNGAALIWL